MLGEENMAFSRPYGSMMGKVENVGHLSVYPFTAKADRQNPANMQADFTAYDRKMTGHLDFYLTEEGIAAVTLEMHKVAAQ